MFIVNPSITSMMQFKYYFLLLLTFPFAMAALYLITRQYSELSAEISAQLSALKAGGAPTNPYRGESHRHAIMDACDALGLEQVFSELKVGFIGSEWRWSDYARGIVLGLVAVGVMYASQAVMVGHWPIMLAAGVPLEQYVLIVTLLLLFIPFQSFLEEFMFRQPIFLSLDEKTIVRSGVVSSRPISSGRRFGKIMLKALMLSVLFAAVHVKNFLAGSFSMVMLSLLPIFLIGLMLCWITYRTDSIAASSGWHFAWNFMVFFIMFVQEFTIQMALTIPQMVMSTLIALVVVIICFEVSMLMRASASQNKAPDSSTSERTTLYEQLHNRYTDQFNLALKGIGDQETVVASDLVSSKVDGVDAAALLVGPEPVANVDPETRLQAGSKAGSAAKPDLGAVGTDVGEKVCMAA